MTDPPGAVALIMKLVPDTSACRGTNFMITRKGAVAVRRAAVAVRRARDGRV